MQLIFLCLPLPINFFIVHFNIFGRWTDQPDVRRLPVLLQNHSFNELRSLMSIPASRSLTRKNDTLLIHSLFYEPVTEQTKSLTSHAADKSVTYAFRHRVNVSIIPAGGGARQRERDACALLQNKHVFQETSIVSRDRIFPVTPQE